MGDTIPTDAPKSSQKKVFPERALFFRGNIKTLLPAEPEEHLCQLSFCVTDGCWHRCNRINPVIDADLFCRLGRWICKIKAIGTRLHFLAEMEGRYWLPLRGWGWNNMKNVLMEEWCDFLPFAITVALREAQMQNIPTLVLIEWIFQANNPGL